MLRSIPLTEIMSTRLLTLHPKDKMVRVKEIFDDYMIHHIPVEVAGKIVGLMSKSDFAMIRTISNNSFEQFIYDKILSSRTVDEFMVKEVYALTINNTVGDAIELFLENKISCLPVVEGNMLRGIVTPYDILKTINKIK